MSAVDVSPTTAYKTPALGKTVARHASAVGAQAIAGVGNLAFAIVAVRLLPGGEYSQLAVFLAAYLLVNTPAASLTAGASMRPDLSGRLLTATLRYGTAAALLLAIASPWVAHEIKIPISLVLLLAVDTVIAGPLAILRGRLFGQQRVGAAAAGIVGEPVVRCAIGLALIVPFGTVGAATGVVCGGYASVALCLLYLRIGSRGSVAAVESAAARGGLSPASTVVAFLVFAIVGAQDVIIANRVLTPTDAGIFAAVSTLGGAVLFATATVPLLVLAPLRARVGAPQAMPYPALGITALASLAVSAAVLSLPTSALHVVLGDRAAGVRAVLPVYLTAMGLLCVARIVLAWLCSNGRAKGALGMTVVAAIVQIALLLHARTVSDAATATLVASATVFVLCAGYAALAVHGHQLAVTRMAADSRARAGTTILTASPADVLPPVISRAPGEGATEIDSPAPEAAPANRGRLRRRALRKRDRLWQRTDVLWAAACAVLGLGIRLSTDRSVWIDEAISVHEASQPYGEMLHLLRNYDVHPPFYFTLLWGVIHATGSTAEAVVRIPSLLPGVVLVAVAYGAALEFWDRRTARFAAVIAAVGPAAVWYAQDARMYALFMLFSTIATWMAVRIIQHGRWKDVAIFTVAAAVLLWTQYDTVLVVSTLLLALLVVAVRRMYVDHGNRRLLWQTLSSAAVIAISFVPLIGWVLHQYGNSQGISSQVPSQTGQTTSSGVNIYSALANVTWALFGYHSDRVMLLINAFWPVLLLLVLGALGRGSSVPVRMLIAVATVPAAILFTLAQQRSDLFDLRYFAATVPALNLLLARMLGSWPKGWFTRRALPLVVSVALVAGLVDEQANSSNPRVYDFRDAVSYVRAHSDPGDLLIYGPSFLTAELEYYKPGMTTVAVGPNGGNTSSHKRIFLLGSFLNEKAVSAAVGTALYDLQHSHHEVAKATFPNVTVWEFE